MRGNAPGQQFVDAVDWMIGNTGQHVAQVSARVDAIEFARRDQRVHGRRPLAAAAVGAGKEEVLSTQGKLALILPISGRKLKSIIVGIRYMVAASRFETSRNAAVVAWFMSKPTPG
jgi:hypothetical protein